MSGKDRINILNFDNISPKNKQKTQIDAVKHKYTIKNHTKMK